MSKHELTITKIETHLPRLVSRILIVAALLTCVAAAPRLALAATAGHIDTIAPSCASQGQQVTITGNGFGALNLQVTVGPVPAQVVSANGNSATFVVPAGVALGLTTVTATNPGGQTGTIGFQVCDLLLPSSWAGQWRFTMTYRNAATGGITHVEKISDVLCDNEPLGMASFSSLAGCTGAVADDHLNINCASQLTVGSCAISGTQEITLNRPASTQDIISGSGAWGATASGDCDPSASGGESIEVAATRSSISQNGCTQPPPKLISSFLLHFPLLAISLAH